jgi:hypothetical protein
MPKKILVLVEGQTEEGFIKRVLSPYFYSKEIFLTPIIINTKKVLHGPNYKGGVKSYQKVKNNLLPLFSDTSASIITTMIDYYAIPEDFPGFNEKHLPDCYKHVEYMEENFSNDIKKERFVPYFQLHEFEALIFASAAILGSVFINETNGINQVNQINSKFTSPEEINKNPESAPSKRLKYIFPSYQKTFHSSLILSNVNVDELRTKCPHFNAWLTRLES